MVIVHLHADAARPAVEAARRPEDLAGRAIAQLVVLVILACYLNVLFLVEFRRLILILLQVIETLDARLVAMQFVELFLLQIQSVVL